MTIEPMSRGVRQLVIRVVERTARLLEAHAAEHDLAKVNERDHLQKQFDIALNETAADWPGVPAVNTGRQVRLPDDFHRVGGVDSSLVWSDGPPLFFELKAGTSLDACAWDAAKLAALLRQGDCETAVLVATAPSSSWPEASPRTPMAGAELFAAGAHGGDELRDRYPSSWRRWDRDGQPADGGPGYRPRRIADQIVTEPAARSRFRTADAGVGGEWEVRASFVTAPLPSSGDAWITWSAP